ncbi:MAG: 3-oxoacyl-ACP synthase [Omnitrophica WOR_2 bacterium SM23_72]|nr:MAG: 3-oxoacyl-ACP synthase [Omnitrophica WOR_2 bacterium SM23_72]
MRKVGIIGVGEYLPKKVLTNADLEKMVETSDEWITTRSGIKERRLADKNEATSDLALKAAKEALEEARLNPKDLELIIVGTITPDMPFPAVSCLLQNSLDAKKAACFDISAACAGFVYGIAVAQQFIARGVYKNALVVGAELLSRVTDWEDRSTCVLFGDGAGAAVLAEVSSGGILSVHMGSDGSKADLLMIPGGGSRIPTSHQSIDQHLHFMKMQGNEVFKLAVTIMADAARTAFNQAGLECKDIDLVIPHQANIRIIMAMAKKLGLAPEKVYLNIEKYGNMSSASTATALCEAVKEGRIKRGDVVLLVAFGAGLVWGACVIKW